EVSQGTFTVAGAGSQFNGSLLVYLDAFGSSTVNLDAPATANNVRVDGAALNANEALSVANLTLTGHGTSLGFAVVGNIGGTGNIDITNSLSWSRGTLTGSGVATVDTNATGAITGNVNLSRELDVAGQLTVGTQPDPVNGGGNSAVNLGTSN